MAHMWPGAPLESFGSIIDRVRILRLSKAGTVFIAIDGPGGAGKSTLAAAVASRFDRAHVVCLDDFAKPIQQLRA
jgi:2-phosphoglycerate kinase